MADNKTVRDGSNATFIGAADELADGSFSPKVSLLDGSGSPTPISPAKASQLPSALGPLAMAASLSITLANDQSPLPITINPASGSGSQTSVAASASSVPILSANAARRGATVMNDSTAKLYLLLASGSVSLTAHTVQLVAGAYYEVPFNYTGAIAGIWAAATGAARVTEFT